MEILEFFGGLIKGLWDYFVLNPDELIFIIFAIIMCKLMDIYYKKFRGYMGEYWVKKELDKLPKEEYTVLNDIMIKDEKGTHQIDHIVLSNYGLFVIEMKNFYGVIRGKEYDQKWCQYLGKNKRYFNNPIHQNYGHIKALSSLLNIDEKYFVSVICISNQAKLKIVANSVVTQLAFLNNEILKNKEVISNFNLNDISKAIINNNIVDKKIRKQHVNDIHSKIKVDKEKEDKMICPKCGNQLIERNGKYGKFIGCSGYPNCRYIKK